MRLSISVVHSCRIRCRTLAHSERSGNRAIMRQNGSIVSAARSSFKSILASLPFRGRKDFGLVSDMRTPSRTQM